MDYSSYIEELKAKKVAQEQPQVETDYGGYIAELKSKKPKEKYKRKLAPGFEAIQPGPDVDIPAPVKFLSTLGEATMGGLADIVRGGEYVARKAMPYQPPPLPENVQKEIPSTQKIADLVATQMEKQGARSAESGFTEGTLPNILTSGLGHAATSVPVMAATGIAPFSYATSAAQAEKRGSPLGEQLAEGSWNAAIGYVQDKLLGGIREKGLNVIPRQLLGGTTMMGIPAVAETVRDVAKQLDSGKNIKDIDIKIDTNKMLSDFIPGTLFPIGKKQAQSKATEVPTGSKLEQPIAETVTKSRQDAPQSTITRPQGEVVEPKIEITTKKQLAEELPPEVGKEQPAAGVSLEEGNRGKGWSLNTKTGEVTAIGIKGDFPTGDGIVNTRKNIETGKYDIDGSSDMTAVQRKGKDNIINKTLGAEKESLANEMSTPEATIGETFGEQFKSKKFQPKELNKPKEKFIFDEPNIERRFQSAVIKPETFVSKIKNVATEFKNRASRTFENLPNTPEFAQANFDLRSLSKQREPAEFKTIKNIADITSGLNPRKYDLFSRKVILDDLAQVASEGKNLPFGFTPESLARNKGNLDAHVTTNYPDIETAIAKRQAVWDDIKNKYIGAMESIGEKVGDRFTNPNYFRHQVIERMEANTAMGRGNKLKTPTGSPWLQKRRGSTMDINRNYIEAEHEVMAQMIHNTSVAETISKFDKGYNTADSVKKKYEFLLKRTADDLGLKLTGNRISEIKKQIELAGPGILKERGLESWKRFIPAGSKTWQPKDGSVFYMADSIPEKLANQLNSGAMEELGITQADLRKVMAMGGKRNEWVVKNEIADTLDNISKSAKDGFLERENKTLMRGWKKWQLISPRRYVKYNIRNISGDADATFVGNPRSFLRVPQAAKELFDYYKNKNLSPDLEKYMDLGGMASTLQSQEMDQIGKLGIFKNLSEKSSGNLNLIKKYWKAARVSTDFREQLLRYASFVDYKKQMLENNGVPKNWGASDKNKIMSLRSVDEKAFELSNDLLGAYDKVSVLGQQLREHIYPFWSWKEANMKRYTQFWKNAVADDNVSAKIGNKLLGTVARSPLIALRVGKFALKATALWTAMTAYNNIFFPDEENDLPEGVRSRPHLILYRDKDGKVVSFNRLGSLGDVLEWFGLDAAPQHVADLFNGKKSLKEVAIAMAKSPVNALASGITPVIKLPAELALNRSLYPDIFKPGTIRDKGAYIAKSIGLDNEYNEIMGKPTEGYFKSIPEFAVYKTDPGQTSYSYIFDEKKRYLNSINRSSEGFWLTPRGNALYNIRLAVRYKDKEAMKKYMDEYVTLGGTQKGMAASFRAMHPLFGLNKDDQQKFIDGLDNEGKERLEKATKFYNEVLGGENPPELNYEEDFDWAN